MYSKSDQSVLLDSTHSYSIRLECELVSLETQCKIEPILSYDLGDRYNMVLTVINVFPV